MKNFLAIVAALCFASFFTVSYGYLAGIQYNFLLTEANREDRFDIVVIDPVAGVASSTQKQVYALYDGVLDISNTVFGPSDWVLSLQTFDYSQAIWGTSSPLHPNLQTSNPAIPLNQPAYLARQNLNEGGRYEYCQLSSTVQPINVFWDTDSSVVATTVNPSGSTFAIHRISFAASSTICASTQLSTITNANSISINVKHQRGNRIYIATEHSNTFTTSPFAQIRIYEVLTSASIVSTTQLPNNIFPTNLATLSPDVIVFQGWSASLSTTGGFGTWEINTTTFSTTTTLTPRSIATSNEELSFTGVIVNRTNTLHSIKNTGVSSTAVTTPIPQFSNTNFNVASAAETKATAVLNDIRIFALYDFPNTTISSLNVDSSATSSNVLLTGTYAFAGQNTGLGAITRATISLCRLTYVGGSTTPVTSPAIGTGDNVSCSIGSIPLGTTAVEVEFAPDGVVYGPKTSFAYSLNSVNALFNGAFRRSVYNFRDGLAAGIREEKITLDAFDNAGRKVLFHPSQTVVLSVQATGNTIVRAVSGNSASVINGVATFPNFSIDIDRAEANNIGVLTVSASFTTTISTTVTNTFTTTVNVEFLTRTTGTLVALAFPDVTSGSQAFETHLINPTLTKSTAALRLTTRTLTDTTGFLGLGLSTYDRDNKVLNTIEINASTNQVTLVGANAFGLSTSTRGVATCRLPSTGSTNDLPSAIFYEGTSADQSTTFLALVNPTDTSLGNGRRLVRYTRAALSTATTLCTSAKVDDLPIFDHYYGNDNVLLLSGGRLAIVEPDAFFVPTNKPALFGPSLLSVWRHSVPATSTQAAIVGSFLIRNKILNFVPVSLSQSGLNEIAISGTTVTGTTLQGIVLVDISTETSTVVAPTGATGLSSSFTASDNSLAYFLHAGSDVTFADARRRYSGLLNSSAQQTVDTQQLARGLVSQNVASSKDVTGRNYLDFFTIDDPAITSVSPSRIAVSGTDTIIATANNVITSSQLKCRFSSATGIPAPQEFSVGSSTTTLTVQNDGAAVNCGSFPATLNGQNAFIYLQLSNDGGNNWGPETRIAVGTITDQANPTVGVIAQTTAGIRTVQFIVKFFSGITNPTTAQDTQVRNAINTVLNNLASYWSKSTVSSAVESNGTTSWSVILTTTTSSAVRFAGLQATSQTTAQLQSELTNAFNPSGVLHPTLSAAGLTSATVSPVTATATSTSSDDLSDGEIAGIVIGSILGFFLIVGVIAFVVLQSKKNKNTYVAPPPSARARDFTVNSSSYSYDSSEDYTDDYTDGETDEDDYSDYI